LTTTDIKVSNLEKIKSKSGSCKIITSNKHVDKKYYYAQTPN